MSLFMRAIIISIILFILCGLIYPLSMTFVCQIFFPWQANGSMVKYQGQPVGSELLGQSFTDMRFFHGRVSSINYNIYSKLNKSSYNGVSSGSTNYALSNPALIERIKKDLDEFLKAHPTILRKQVPIDLLTNSSSGLDPHLSPKAAWIQIPAIAKATGFTPSELQTIVNKFTKNRFLGIFGEPRVNILKVNLEIARRLKLNLTEKS